MCGIVGLVTSSGCVKPDVLKAMRDAVAHRGPDDAGLWISSDGEVGLAHRRLSIIDLSEAGRQPMSDRTRQVWVTFNGEIYNFQEIRSDLEKMGHGFCTGSDTEVILNAYLQWGTNCLSRFNGMFAFGLYDQRNRQIFLARDRVGKKPLYYISRPSYFAFASELKALLADRTQEYRMDVRGFNFYLTYGYVPGEYCILAEVRKLPPAHAMTFDVNTRQIRTWRYWSPPSLQSYRTTPDGEALSDELGCLLEDSVRLRMISDVPLGVLLSGGVDSSLVAALAARQSSRPVKTFTIRFPGQKQYDETPFARRVASFFETDHHELVAQPESVEVLHHLALQFDEPLADSSILPTFLVSQLTRKEVTVALGGDGGDELFGSYNHYALAQKHAQKWGWLPERVLARMSSVAALLPPGVKGRGYLIGLRKGFYRIGIYSTPYYDPFLRRHILSPEAATALGDQIEEPEQFKLNCWQSTYANLTAMMRLDFDTYLPDDVLAKVDRTSMAVALEVRSPWLDYRIMEFAFKKVPEEWKVYKGISRRLQRALAQRLLPSDLNLARKQGFSVPMDRWLVSDWRKFAEQTLVTASAPYIDWDCARKLWNGELRGRVNGARIFALLMYELWWQAYKGQISVG